MQTLVIRSVALSMLCKTSGAHKLQPLPLGALSGLAIAVGSRRSRCLLAGQEPKQVALDVVVVHHADQEPCVCDLLNDLARPGALLIERSPLTGPQPKCLILQPKEGQSVPRRGSSPLRGRMEAQHACRPCRFASQSQVLLMRQGSIP